MTRRNCDWVWVRSLITRVMLNAIGGTSTWRDLGVDGQQIIVATDGDAETGEIDRHRSAGGRGATLATNV